jgi:hypothetical protein
VCSLPSRGLIFVWNYLMKFKLSSISPADGRWPNACALLLCLVLAGCAATPTAPRVPRFDDPGPEPALNYYHFLSRMTANELGRERMVLAALPANPNTQIRTAMLLGHPRGPQDLLKATALLESLMKSTDPVSISLQPLARMLADNYIERQKLESQIDRQGVQLKESQRKAVELQEKIDKLADIERSLPPRRPAAPGAAR